MPFPPIDGGAQVMHFSSNGLIENNIDVQILAINPTRQYVDVSNIPKDYLQNFNFKFVVVDTRLKLIPLILNLFKTESYFTERFTSVDFNRQLISVLSNDKFDIIQLEHVYLCKYISTIRKYSNSNIILRPQNVEYVIWERYNSGISNPFKKLYLKINIKRLKKFEIRCARLVDGILALTKEDELLFKSFATNTKTAVIPMGYDYNRIKSYNFLDQFNYPASVYHLGTMDWLPNEEGVKWFIEKVAPLLELKKYKGTIHLAGNKMPQWVYSSNFSFIKVSGLIEDPLDFQKDKQIMIVPLLSGSGIRAKIIEGLALGKIIISTTIGAQGIDYKNEENLFIADTPEDFANKIDKLTRDIPLCKTISANARKLSESQYNNEIISKKMIKFYKDCLE